MSALWLTNSKGQILLAQRGLHKKNHPGKWGPAAAGTIEEGETYKSNIYKEVEEEIGLTDVALKEGPKLFTDDGVWRHFCQWYIAVADNDAKDFVLEENQIEQVAWFDPEQLKQELKTQPEKFLPSAPEVWPKYFL